MSLGNVMLVLMAEIWLVTGQILLKRAMNLTHLVPVPRWRVSSILTAGIASMTLWFFIWSGLLQRLDLSYVFPFEGLVPVLLVGAAWFLLREKVGWRVWAGVGLIATGTVVVGLSA